MPNNRQKRGSKRDELLANKNNAEVSTSDYGRREHKKIFSIEQSDTLGRYIIANRDINAGEIIIENEEPLVVGPVQQSQFLCLGCYVIIRNVNNYRCLICKWPMCGENCEGLYQKHGHTREECKTLTNISFDSEMEKDIINIYNVIVPLRCLLLKKMAQSKWKILMNMESHNSIRKTIKNIWEMNEITVVEKLKKYFDPEEIHTVCGILEVNCFEVTKNESSLRALFPVAFLLAHDCRPNTVHTNDNSLMLKIRASVEISRAQLITISYAYTLQGTAKRRAHIKETKFFDCICKRCTDPKELGTNCSTIVCPNCGHASLICSNPLSIDAPWICRFKKCAGFSAPQEYVHNLIEKCEDELKLISDDDIESYEVWLKDASNSLHENHYLVLGVKYTLGLMYGKISGYMIQDLSEDLLKRKINICQDLLKIADAIEPGLSRLRGTILYELHAPIMMSVSQKFRSQSITKKQMKHSLQKVVQYLKEACNILEFESHDSIEGSIGYAAREALNATIQWEKILGKFT